MSTGDSEQPAIPATTSSAPPSPTDEKTVLFQSDSDSPAPTVDFAAGGGVQPSGLFKTRTFGEYELLEEIARGGMGVVYKAKQTKLNRLVALKMILSGQLASTDDIKRFHSEAEAAANLDHTGIVPIHAVGEQDGQHYFAMAFVEGETLAACVTAGALPPARAAELMAQVADAIAYAHGEGVIHRDLKPANILIDRDGQPRVTDFGLAKHNNIDKGLTATGQVMGTPSYMSPEQAAGDSKKIDQRSDVYSLGAILFELLTGRPPFRRDTALDTLMDVLESAPPSARSLNPSVPRDLESVCRKCLEKDPKQRYSSATALASDLKQYLKGEAISASSSNMLSRVSRTLAHSRNDRELGDLGTLLLWFAAVIFVVHVAIFVLLSLEYPRWIALWMPRGIMAGVLLALIWYYRPQTVLPTNPVERAVWAIWIGYLLAYASANIVLNVLGRPETEAYAWSSLLSGMGFVAMAPHTWGIAYLIGAIFFVTAPVLAMSPTAASVSFGTLWAIALASFGWRYRKTDRPIV